MSGRNKSRQTSILRRRLTLHTALAWLIYSVLFIAFAFFANAFIVPAIADFIIDKTAVTIDYSPEQYLERYGQDQLLAQYLQSLDEQGVDYEFTSLNDMSPEEAGLIADAAEPTDAQAEGDAIQEIRLVDAASDQPIGVIELWSSSGKETDTVVLTPSLLARDAMGRDYVDVTTMGGEWQMLPYNDGSEGFQAREVSFYNDIKQLKIPIAVVLYLIGCLAIIMLEMRRAMGYFDQLSGAVAGLMADRSQPVQLSDELALAQEELNDIRLEALNDERIARSAEQRKNELVAYLAHDIRTPLTSIIGYLSMLDESPDLPEEQRVRFTHTAFEKAESLEGLINEFFEITRYNLQSIPLERSWVDIRLMLQQLADEFLPQAQDRHVSIQVDTPGEALLFVDASKLARALENVLRNAIAYADESTAVGIKVERICTLSKGGNSEAAGSGEAAAPIAAEGWSIAVSDSGREISPAHLESIFEKFYREDAARSTEGGAGLGLAIAKEIVVAHGGSISAASEQGRTVFTITLPDPSE